MDISDLIVGKRYLIKTDAHLPYPFTEIFRAKFCGVTQHGTPRFKRLLISPVECTSFIVPSNRTLYIIQPEDAWWEIFSYQDFIRLFFISMSWFWLGAGMTILILAFGEPIYRAAKDSVVRIFKSKSVSLKKYLKDQLKSFLND